MAETINTAEAAIQISSEIFEVFKWKTSELFDQNLNCEIETHQKKSHPCDCVFYYVDPYLGKIIYLNTDLKSYGAASITKTSVKNALRSLSLATHCAGISDSWNQGYLLPNCQFDFEVRGFLFVYNHDNAYSNDFNEQLLETNCYTLPIAKSNKLHVFGPDLIQDCYAIASDINIEIGKRKISQYTFWYPDMMLHKVRHGGTWEQPATIELLSSPIIIVQYETTNNEEGFIIYYKRHGDTEDEFIYLLDLLSHYQLLSQGLKIDLKFIGKNSSPDIRTNFRNAKYSYMQTWSMDEAREQQLDSISPSLVTRHSSHYNIGELGWRE